MATPTPQPTGPTPVAPGAPARSSQDIINAINNMQFGDTTNEPLGVPADWQVPARETGPLGPMGPQSTNTPTPYQTPPQTAFTLYTETDTLTPASSSVEDIAALQVAMSRAGLLTGTFRAGIWDKKSRTAYRELLGYANQQGMEWNDALNHYASTGVANDPNAFSPGKFVARDPAHYRNSVRTMFREAFGRDPDDDELERYASEKERMEQGAFREAKQTWRDVTDAGGDMGAKEFTAIRNAALDDRAARFTERFEQRYRPESEFINEQTANAEQGGLLAGILGGIDEVA